MKNGELLNRMLTLAVNAHSGQFDKSGNPYILHVLKVLHYVRSSDEELNCIAVGHDLFEDTSVTANDLYNLGMTKRIVDAIFCLTKMPGQTYNEYKDAVFSNKDAMIVKKL